MRASSEATDAIKRELAAAMAEVRHWTARVKALQMALSALEGKAHSRPLEFVIVDIVAAFQKMSTETDQLHPARSAAKCRISLGLLPLTTHAFAAA